MANPALFQRQCELVKRNVEWLSQAVALLQEISDQEFCQSPQGISGHVRHVIEFYECFFEGLEWLHVDYDARRRDQALEASRAAAIERIHALIGRLQSEPALAGDGAIFVRMEDSRSEEIPEPFLLSSVGRELQALSSHTVHHFALIAATLKASGRLVAPEFGVAPATLRYLKAAA